MKPNYLIIPLLTFLVAFGGSLLTSSGMNWYQTELIRPDFTPPKIVFPVAWTIIFVLTMIAALVVWNKAPRDRRFDWMIALFIINAVLNVLWSFLFFSKHLIFASFIEMTFLDLTIVFLMELSCKIKKIISWLLLPYFLWVSFATFLTYQVMLLN